MSRQELNPEPSYEETLRSIRDRQRANRRKAILWTSFPIALATLVLAFSVYQARQAMNAMAQVEHARSRLDSAQTVTDSLAVATRMLNSQIQEKQRELESLNRTLESYSKGEVPVIYIQRSDSVSDETVQALRGEFFRNHIPTPGAQRISGRISSRVAYFHAQDRRTAQQVQQIAEEFFRKAGCPQDLPAQYLSGLAARSGLVELWIGKPCEE
jgi:hypothetical protein